jgi:hypothetical protein
MRTKLALIPVLVMLLFGVIALSPNGAVAQEEGAVIAKDFGCSVYLPPAPTDRSIESHSVITPSGNTTFTCHFEGPSIAETYVTEGFVCNTFAGSTNDMHFVYTKSGRGTLTCHINGNG